LFAKRITNKCILPGLDFFTRKQRLSEKINTASLDHEAAGTVLKSEVNDGVDAGEFASLKGVLDS